MHVSKQYRAANNCLACMHSTSQHAHVPTLKRYGQLQCWYAQHITAACTLASSAGQRTTVLLTCPTRSSEGQQTTVLLACTYNTSACTSSSSEELRTTALLICRHPAVKGNKQLHHAASCLHAQHITPACRSSSSTDLRTTALLGMHSTSQHARLLAVKGSAQLRCLVCTAHHSMHAS
jgi:hypothetical protein